MAMRALTIVRRHGSTTTWSAEFLMVIQRCRDGYVLILMQCLGAARCSLLHAGAVQTRQGVLYKVLQLPTGFLGWDSQTFQCPAPWPDKELHRTLSPCALRWMDQEESCWATEVLQSNPALRSWRSATCELSHYLPTSSVYMPTTPPSSTKLSVICLSVWGLHTYACLYHVIWLANECRKTYIVTLQQIVVGGTIVVPANIQAIVDTGTSFTYFSTPVYTQFAEVVRIKRYFLLKFIACVCFQSHMFQKFPVFFSHSFLRFLSSVCNWSSISYLSFCRLCVFHLMFFFGISWEHVNKLSSTYGFFTAETMPFPCRIRRVYPRCTSKQMIWV
jgi:hypothetical protein